MEVDPNVSEGDDMLGDLTEPITWRHRFVQWIAHFLAVRLYTAPTIVLIDNRRLRDDEPVVRH